MVTVLGVAVVAFQSAKTSMQQLIFEQLEVAATLKERALNLWVENQKNATFSLAQLPDIQTATQILVTDDPGFPRVAGFSFSNPTIYGFGISHQTGLSRNSDFEGNRGTNCFFYPSPIGR
ncbi:MAG: hypothetical protein RSE13_20475 [Planktothrix sp. GU0601_MAG3]|nr:MAG: hypothetical protein RSE13_20475 [Planktothrix sp. GU0601_MAG3]